MKNMSILVRGLSVVALGSLLCMQSGCLLVAAGAATGATVAYVAGDLHSTVDASPQRVAEAAERAMAALEISVISTASSSIDARVVGRTARDNKLTVSAKSSSAKFSQLTIRAGTFGDDALQARLLEEIRVQLTPAQLTRGQLTPGQISAEASAEVGKTPSTQPALAGEQP